MTQYDYDLFTIGAGSGGVRASRLAAEFGAKVAIAEKQYLGGTCVNVGCIPKKLMAYAAHFHHDLQDAKGFGWKVGESSFDWNHFIHAKNEEILRLNGVYERILKNSGVEIINGHARICDPHRIEINGECVSAKYILICTGSHPVIPKDWPGIEFAMTSNEAFFLTELPKHIMVVGGGYIGVEFAGIFNGLGSQVTLVHRGEAVLRGFDSDLRTELTQAMKQQGVDMRLGHTLQSLELTANDVLATLSGGQKVPVDHVLLAIGRFPNILNLGLETTEVEIDAHGGIVVDDYYKTHTPNIYAIGDVINCVQLTPVALNEGIAVANTLFNDHPTRLNYDYIPSAVFSVPPIGTVGLTEDKARQKYGEIDVYTSRFRPLKHTISGRQEYSFMKLVVDRTSERVVGCHMLGADAPEILQGFAVAVNAGLSKSQFDATIGIHPTAAEEFVTMRQKRED